MKKSLLLAVVALLGWGFASVTAGDRAIDAADYETAIAEYEDAYNQDNSNIEALYKLAQAKTYLAETLAGDEAANLYSEAAEHARKAAAAAPDSAAAHFEVARAVGRLAQFRGVLESINLAGEVKTELERTLELDPNHGGAYHALALWNLEVPWIAGGRTGQVAPLFDKAIAAEPDSITHRVDYAEALIKLDNPEAAREQLTVALSLTPQNPRDEADLAKARELQTSLP